MREEALRTPRLLARSLHQAGARITAVRAYSSSSQFDADAELLLADQPRETGDIARWWARENIPSLPFPPRLVSRNLPAILLGVGDEPPITRSNCCRFCTGPGQVTDDFELGRPNG